MDVAVAGIYNDVSRLGISTAYIQEQEELKEKTSLKDKRIERKAVKQERRDAKQIEKIREEVILNCLGVTKKDYENMLSNKSKFESDLEKRTEDSEMDEVRQSMNVANGAFGAERASGRELRNTVLGVIGCAPPAILGTAVAAGLTSVGFPMNAVLLEVAALGLTLTPAGIISGVIATIFGVITVKRILKRGKGEASDTIEKVRASLDKIKDMLNKINVLEAKVASDTQMILDNKKSMKKAEFKQFLKDYIDGINANLGKILEEGTDLEPFKEFAQEVASEQVENLEEFSEEKSEEKTSEELEEKPEETETKTTEQNKQKEEIEKTANLVNEEQIKKEEQETVLE